MDCPLCEVEIVEGCCPQCKAPESYVQIFPKIVQFIETRESGIALEVSPHSAELFGATVLSRGEGVWQYVAINLIREGMVTKERLCDDYMDLDHLFFPDDMFDVFIMANISTLRRVFDYEQALTEINRVLKPNGVAYMKVDYSDIIPFSTRHRADDYKNIWNFGVDIFETMENIFRGIDQDEETGTVTAYPKITWD